jgi:hypothetical protein
LYVYRGDMVEEKAGIVAPEAEEGEGEDEEEEDDEGGEEEGGGGRGVGKEEEEEVVNAVAWNKEGSKDGMKRGGDGDKEDDAIVPKEPAMLEAFAWEDDGCADVVRRVEEEEGDGEEEEEEEDGAGASVPSP